MELKLEKKINGILGEVMSDEKYFRISGNIQNLSDAVKEQIPNIEAAERFFRYCGDEKLEDFIQSRLGHLSANPSDEEKSNIIIKTFVHAGPNTNENDEEKELRYPNYNERATLRFVKALIDSSRNELLVYKGAKVIARENYMLVGDRGIGKTIFLNYVMSKYERTKMAENKVITVRINVSQRFGGDEPDLGDWLQAKASKIIIEYYYPRQEEHEELSELFEYLKEQIEKECEEEQRIRYQNNVLKIKRMYLTKELQETLSAGTINPNIARWIVDFAIRKGYSFIYVIDGFDRIGITERHKEYFNHLVDQINYLLTPTTKYGGVFLIVCRTETRLALSNSQFYATTKITNITAQEIHDTEFRDIIEKRLEYIKKKASEFKDAFSCTQEDINNHLIKFESYINDLTDKQEFGEAIASVDENFGRNHRSKMQLIQLCYYSFVKDEGKQHYKLIYQMCTRGYYYPNCTYSYSCNEDGMLTASTLCDKVFDNIFAYNFYRYPYSKEFCQKHNIANISYLLAATRVLQVITAIEKNIQHVRREILTPVPKVLQLLKTFFGYNQQIIWNILEEMAEHSMLVLSGATLVNPTRIENHLVKRAKNVCERYTCRGDGIINDIAYLHLCSMRVLVNPECLKSNHAYFVARSIHKRGVSVPQWVVDKIMNSISSFRLIRKCDIREKENIARMDENKLSETERVIRKIILEDQFVDEMRKKIIPQIKVVINKMAAQWKEDFMEKLYWRLCEYQKMWCG